LSEHYRTRIEQVASLLSERECVTFGLECALRALAVWEATFPDDRRPREAVEAVQAWLQDSDYRADFDGLCRAAEQSHIDVDYPELTEAVDPPLVAAMEATGACSHAAIAVQSILEDQGHEELAQAVGWIARFAVKASHDRRAESDRQRSRLIAMLLE
jgi:hypothetical protein